MYDPKLVKLTSKLFVARNKIPRLRKIALSMQDSSKAINLTFDCLDDILCAVIEYTAELIGMDTLEHPEGSKHGQK